MGQTLTNGIFLPNEGERNCYTGLAGNWRAIDGCIGDYNVHVADAVIHVSQADRDKWDAVDNKADASALTAHTGDTTIHVTAADKQTWDTGVTQAYVLRYASVSLTALGTVAFSALDNTDNLKVGDKVIDSSGVLFSITAIDTQNSTFTIGTALIDLAQDSDVVHKSGNETVGGVKTFSNDIRISKASPFYNIFSSGYIKGQAPASNIYSGVRFFDDINSGSTNTITGGFEVEYNRDGYNKSYISSRNYAGENHKFFTVGLRVPNDDIRSIDFLSSVNGIVNLGTSTNKWKTLNGINPGALGMPDLSNGIDISGYVDVTQTSQYTAPADGYISICGSASSSNTMLIQDHDYDFAQATRAVYNTSSGYASYLVVPVNKNHTYDITCSSVKNIRYAYFFPCQGNV